MENKTLNKDEAVYFLHRRETNTKAFRACNIFHTLEQHKWTDTANDKWVLHQQTKTMTIEITPQLKAWLQQNSLVWFLRIAEAETNLMVEKIGQAIQIDRLTTRRIQDRLGLKQEGICYMEVLYDNMLDIRR